MTEKQLIYKKEPIYFVLVVLASIVFYAATIISLDSILLVASILLIYWVIHLYMMVSIRKNAVQISAQQFPDIYAKAEALASQMQLKRMPSIYVMESGGLLNAFATKFGSKNMVVMYSNLFALIEDGAEDEVTYILAHEFAHLKRHHVNYSWLLFPGLMVPFLSSAYSRACEFTCDTYGAYYTNNFKAAENALTILAIGPTLFKKVNKDAFVDQVRSNRGLLSWLDEITSSHPNLPRRIDYLKAVNDRNYPPKDTHSLKHVVIGSIGFILFTAAIIVCYVWLSPKIDKWLLEEDEGIYDWDESFYDEESMNVLMKAVINNDLDTLQANVMNQARLEETNDDGYTALHIAVLEDNVPFAKLLLEAGSPVDTVDEYYYTPLIDAIYYENPKMVELLLQHGASLNFLDGEAYEMADSINNAEINELISRYENTSK